MEFDVAIVGAGLSGMTAASLLQSRGLRTVILEAHAIPGGCAGYYRRRGFSFDVGATTLVDFEPDGVGGRLLRELDLNIRMETLPGYHAWLPDRMITLHRERLAWARERTKLGDSPAHRAFWRRIDSIAESFWSISRRGGRLPIRSLGDFTTALAALRWRDVIDLRYLNWTVSDLLRSCRLDDDRALTGLLSIIVEDTVHAPLDRAPLVNAALGITMRGAGLNRARGGMRGFWNHLVARYESLGGELRRAHRVERIEGSHSDFTLHTSRGTVAAKQVISTLPIELTHQLSPPAVREVLSTFIERDRQARGGAIVVFLGVPESEVGEQLFTHHQLLQSYEAPLGNGNNMFISVSSPDDTDSAPAGWRSVMISTHCELDEWEGLEPAEYARRKKEIGQTLIEYARRVFPDLGQSARIIEVGTPMTYERFTGRPRGAVGGVRLDLARTNQRAVPHEIGVPGFFLAGDTTWPGVGTVACVINGRAAADHALAACPRNRRVPSNLPPVSCDIATEETHQWVPGRRENRSPGKPIRQKKTPTHQAPASID